MDLNSQKKYSGFECIFKLLKNSGHRFESIRGYMIKSTTNLVFPYKGSLRSLNLILCLNTVV